MQKALELLNNKVTRPVNLIHLDPAIMNNMYVLQIVHF